MATWTTVIALAAVSIFGIMYFSKSMCRIGKDGNDFGGMVGPNGSLCFPGWDAVMGKDPTEEADEGGEDETGEPLTDGETDVPTTMEPTAPEYPKGITPAGGKVSREEQSRTLERLKRQIAAADYAQSYYTSRIQRNITVA